LVTGFSVADILLVSDSDNVDALKCTVKIVGARIIDADDFTTRRQRH